MAPERIFQGRQRGILGLVGGKDTCNPHLTSSTPGPCNLNSKRRLLPCSAPLSPAHDAKQRTRLSPEAAPSPRPRGPARQPEPPTQEHRAAPAARNCPGPPLRLPRKGALHPEDAWCVGLPLPEKGGLRGALAPAGRVSPGPRAPRSAQAAFLTAAARGCSA